MVEQFTEKPSPPTIEHQTPLHAQLVRLSLCYYYLRLVCYYYFRLEILCIILFMFYLLLE